LFCKKNTFLPYFEYFSYLFTIFFCIFKIFSVFDLPFFHIFHIISQFNLGFFCILHIFSLFNLAFFHICHIISLFSLLFFHISFSWTCLPIKTAVISLMFVFDCSINSDGYGLFSHRHLPHISLNFHQRGTGPNYGSGVYHS
jgi:hypothetical protein